jgi:hypothetical protein
VRPDLPSLEAPSQREFGRDRASPEYGIVGINKGIISTEIAP